ncbi:hypothetical protein ACFDR9_005331, partial [Janthinobacterium sp. CG_23.3]
MRPVPGGGGGGAEEGHHPCNPPHRNNHPSHTLSYLYPIPKNKK